ncbi:MAG TPA: hypothetical protein VGM88_08805 [Kofleriaceae bacterium]|jgi:hypothetical protein
MIERALAAPRRSWVPATALALGALALGVSYCHAEAPPPPPVVVNLVVPPAAAAPTTAHTGCHTDPSLVGTPAIESTGGPRLDDAALASDGCTLAAWQGHTLYASWDGGEHVATLDAGAAIFTVAAGPGRIVVVRDHQSLGFLSPADTQVRWVALDPELATSELVPFTVAAGGTWTVVQTATSLAITGDDAVTWTRVPLPEERLRWTTPQLSAAGDDGSVRDRFYEELGDGGPLREHALTFSAGAWHDALVPPVTAGGWRYRFAPDRSWGCGGTVKLVASRGKTHITIAKDLREDAFPDGVGTGSLGTFAMYGGVLYELRAGHATRVAATPDDAYWLGVDAYGAPLVRAVDHVERWTPGGWRVII